MADSTTCNIPIFEMAIDKKTQGAWIIQYGKTIHGKSNVASSFPTIDVAVKAGSLLSRILDRKLSGSVGDPRALITLRTGIPNTASEMLNNLRELIAASHMENRPRTEFVSWHRENCLKLRKTQQNGKSVQHS